MKKIPLATILRPKSVKDVFGHEEFLNKDGIIRKMVDTNTVYSLIFYGKPGIGKTTLATALANDLKIPYKVFNATTDSKSDLSSIIELAKLSSRYILIVEEIHRLNRDKQDILLSSLEEGIITMFATTTENPFFVINPAIRSRCQIIQLKPLNNEAVSQALKSVVKKYKIKNIDDKIIKFIASKTQGDIRSALNIVDVLSNLYADTKIDLDILNQVMSQSYVVNAHYGDEIHDLKSALHKSIRGSDVDASLHYLARLITSHDIVSISRRLIMVAYEDIGLANPNLAMRVYLGLQAAKEVGLPEASIILANLVIEMALSPKSNSCTKAINKALTDVASGKAYEIPMHLRDAHYASSVKLGIKGYKYPHDYENAWVDQQYLPNELKLVTYYEPPSHSVHEKKLSAWLKNLSRYKED